MRTTRVELARTWIEECNKKHVSCVAPERLKFPTRVLDVGDNFLGIIFLKETMHSDQDRYITLSHCWGEEQIITTTTGSLEQRKSGILLSQLTNAFRPAVEITRGLRVRYLWIDSLFIIQDDKHDWEIESASWLNLAATNSKDGKGGC
jgi:hypothetical protein